MHDCTCVVKVHLSHEELAELKRAASATLPSGSKALTSNEALSAALTLALSDHMPKDKPVSAAMAVSMLGKGVLKNARGAAGNFSWALGALGAKPGPELTMADAALLWRQIGDDWRDESR